MREKQGNRRTQAGFSLLEIMASLSIFLLLFLGTATAIIGSKNLSSFVKHKAQAMYWAQRYIEQERRLTFANLTSLASASIPIDTNGTFTATNDDFSGNRIITVTTVDASRKRVRIEINWTEKIMGGLITVRDYYSTDIVNDSQLN